jgi:hypothetical protein
MGQGTKKATTDAEGTFKLSGFSAGDIAIVAEHETLGRSRGMRLPTMLPGQTELRQPREFGARAPSGRQPKACSQLPVDHDAGAIFGVVGPRRWYR